MFTITVVRVLQYLNPIAPNVDYTTIMNDEVVFAIGECTKDVNVSILVNAEREDDEIFNVTLSTDCCADITTGQVEVTITESGPDGKKKCLKFNFIVLL